jgi:hypothetical protein
MFCNFICAVRSPKYLALCNFAVAGSLETLSSSSSSAERRVTPAVLTEQRHTRSSTVQQQQQQYPVIIIIQVTARTDLYTGGKQVKF